MVPYGLAQVAQRLSSGAFEATPAFATAKVGGGSNVTCSDLLGLCMTTLDFINVPVFWIAFVAPDDGWANPYEPPFLG